MKAIILAAGMGKRLRPHTDKLPKCLIKIKGRPILERQIGILRDCGVKDILVVSGFKFKKVKDFCRSFRGVEVIRNPFYAYSNSVVSVWLSMNKWNGDLIFMNSDIILERKLLKRIVTNRADLAVLVKKGDRNGYRVRIENGRVRKMSMDIPDSLTFGVYAGITKIRAKRLGSFGAVLARWLEAGRLNDWYEDVVSEISGSGAGVKPILIDSFFWHEIDTPEELNHLRRRLK